MTDGNEQIEVEEWYCPYCGWLEPEYQAGDPALCPNCGVEYPHNRKKRIRTWPRCPGWNEDHSKCDRQTKGEYCHDHSVDSGTECDSDE